MATHSEADLQFEIGHVLFIDIAGYSKLLINEQSELIRQLKEVVWGTEQFRRAAALSTLIARGNCPHGRYAWRYRR
ncbi:MAG TPA: hypothetical protein VFU09_11895 [Candidatus Udaeobacter sp.]|jgi:hypothetical protein|nr:hypothetical protein [Candidatus Udaeobacter sp.]